MSVSPLHQHVQGTVRCLANTDKVGVQTFGGQRHCDYMFDMKNKLLLVLVTTEQMVRIMVVTVAVTNVVATINAIISNLDFSNFGKM